MLVKTRLSSFTYAWLKQAFKLKSFLLIISKKVFFLGLTIFELLT